MSENIGIEKVVSHKQYQQQPIGGIWVVVEVVSHEPVVRLYTAQKRKLYSGLFILLKRNDNIVKHIWEDIMKAVFLFFRRLAFGYVRTHV